MLRVDSNDDVAYADVEVEVDDADDVGTVADVLLLLLYEVSDALVKGIDDKL